MENLGTVTSYFYVPTALAKAWNNQYHHLVRIYYRREHGTQQLSLLTSRHNVKWDDIIISCNLLHKLRQTNKKKLRLPRMAN